VDITVITLLRVSKYNENFFLTVNLLHIYNSLSHDFRYLKIFVFYVLQVGTNGVLKNKNDN
jgi:hypothetical protein